MIHHYLFISEVEGTRVETIYGPEGAPDEVVTIGRSYVRCDVTVERNGKTYSPVYLDKGDLPKKVDHDELVRDLARGFLYDNLPMALEGDVEDFIIGESDHRTEGFTDEEREGLAFEIAGLIDEGYTVNFERDREV